MNQSQINTFKYIRQYHLSRFNYYSGFKIGLTEFSNEITLDELFDELNIYIIAWRQVLLKIFEKDTNFTEEDINIADQIRMRLMSIKKAQQIVINMKNVQLKFEAKQESLKTAQ